MNSESYKSGSFVETNAGVNTVTFDAVTASIEDVNFENTKLDFLFFANGLYIPHDSFDIQQSGSLFYLSVSTGSLGYSLDSSDEIIGWGKFEV